MSNEEITKAELSRESREPVRSLDQTGRPIPPAEELPGEPKAEEPWLPIETKLVTYSVIAGIATLIVLATVVHIFILGGHSG